MGTRSWLSQIALAVTLALAAWGPCQAQGAPDEALIRRGEYLARAGDCVACHTAPAGKAMAGGLALPTPLGEIMSTNITPSKTHGIGNYTYEQFADAMRRGLRADGAHLYPAMPYTSYALVTDEDMRALYAYFMQAVAPVDEASPPTKLPFPFNIRLSMAVWNMLFLKGGPFQPDPNQSAEWNRGAYLARGLAHCGACHTPRNLMMAEDSSREFAGGEVGPWYAPNITSDNKSGIGGWSVQELATYMKTGHAADKGQAAGPMAEAIDYSLRFLDDVDLAAMGTFLKTVPAINDPADTRPAFAWGRTSNHLPELRGVSLPWDADSMTGAQLYDAYCSTCHQASGEGSFDGSLPSLVRSTALGHTQTNNLVLVMLQGLHREPDIFMPAFDELLSDRQITTLGNYLLQNFGNPDGRVTLEQVRDMRAGGAPPPLASMIWPVVIGLLAAVVIVALLVWFLLTRRRSRRVTAG